MIILTNPVPVQPFSEGIDHAEKPDYGLNDG